jgi:predicted deacylase
MNVILNILTHGDEIVGLKVAKEIGKLQIQNGHVEIQVANELAYQKRRRFIDQDLNRSFPGKSDGNHEQRLAAKIAPKVKEADVVIDIHSTRSGLKDALIVTKINKKTRECIESIAPKYLLYMRATKNNALISNAKIGIAFEYGKNNDERALKNIVMGIKRLLIHLNMLKGDKKRKSTKTTWLDVYGTVPKPKGARLSATVKNYKIIKRGSVFASHKGNVITAPKTFYPILFGENSYKEIFGFKARLLK